jgi:hypothetical protein
MSFDEEYRGIHEDCAREIHTLQRQLKVAIETVFLVRDCIRHPDDGWKQERGAVALRRIASSLKALDIEH